MSLKTKMFKKNMCAPASVADHLLWLDKTAFKNITKESHPIMAGVDLVHTLSREQYMKTSTGGSGTSLGNVVTGTYEFLKDRGIPVKKITVIFRKTGILGTDDLLVQLGTAGGIDTTNYEAESGYITLLGRSVSSLTTGFNIQLNSDVFTGHMTIVNLDGNQWVSSHAGSHTASTIATVHGGGYCDLTGVLTQLRVTRTSTGTFDNGKVNIIYE